MNKIKKDRFKLRVFDYCNLSFEYSINSIYHVISFYQVNEFIDKKMR